MASDFARQKYKQYICENSPELREFERHLQTAYNRYMLDAKLAFEKEEREREKALAKEAQKAEERSREKDGKQLQEKEEARHRREREMAAQLESQMIERQLRWKSELSVDHALRLQLEKELEDERAAEERKAIQRKMDKERRHKEQLEMQLEKERRRAEERQTMLAEDERRQREVNELANYDQEIIEERQRRIQQFQKVQEKLAEQLTELERLKEEEEEIRQKLLAIEKEEHEREKEEMQVKKERQKREASRQDFDEITAEKREEEMKIKLEDTLYAEGVRLRLLIEEERLKAIKENQWQRKLSVRADNVRLIELRRQLRANELKMEREAVKAEETARAEREKVVVEERRRLLLSLGPDFVAYLPRGCLDHDDLLCLSTNRPI